MTCFVFSTMKKYCAHGKYLIVGVYYKYLDEKYIELSFKKDKKRRKNYSIIMNYSIHSTVILSKALRNLCLKIFESVHVCVALSRRPLCL